MLKTTIIYVFVLTIIISLCILATSMHNENNHLRKQNDYLYKEVYDIRAKNPLVTKEYDIEVSDKDYQILMLTELNDKLFSKVRSQDSLITKLKTKKINYGTNRSRTAVRL